MQRTDHMNEWEKAALFATGAGGAFNILLYQLGYTLADAAPPNWWLFGARVFFALVSFVGFDLTLVVTVMAMRAGRRSAWAWLTVLAATLAAAGIALDVSAVWGLPWMHAAPVVVLAAFMLHLAAPRVADRREALLRRAEQAETDLTQARNELDQTRDEAGRLRNALEQALRAAETERDAGGAAVTQAETALAHERQRAARLEGALAQLQAEVGQVPLVLGGKALTLEQVAAAFETSKSSVARKLARVAQP